VKLVVLEGPAARQAFDVRNDRTLIGRAPECDVLVFDAQVSRYHAQILRQGHAYFLENLQPANPTIVNDRVMQTRRRLVDGDLIVMGTVVLEVDIPPATVSDDQRRAAEAITDRAELDAPSLVPQASATAAQPTAERLTPRIPTLPPLSPREQLRSVAGRLAAAGQRLQTRLAPSSSLPTVAPRESAIVAAIVTEHERLGGDAELSRLAGLLSERLANQTDIRSLYRLGAEATGLASWSRLAQHSIEEAVHLADVLGVHRAV
jgi:pSer/pThr/pTyr-binding forkhead associated (FHA) protein